MRTKVAKKYTLKDSVVAGSVVAGSVVAGLVVAGLVVAGSVVAGAVVEGCVGGSVHENKKVQFTFLVTNLFRLFSCTY